MSEPLYLRINEPGRADFNEPMRQSLTLGRSKKNICRLHDGTVSREHAVLVETRNGWLIVNVAKDNTIRVVQGDKDRTLKHFDDSPLTEGTILQLGRVKCEVTRERGTPKPDSTLRSRSRMFRSRTGDFIGAARSSAPDSNVARPVSTTVEDLIPGRGKGRMEGGEAEALGQDTKMGLVVADGKREGARAGSERRTVESQGATDTSGGGETIKVPDSGTSWAGGILCLEAANPRLLILKEGHVELVALKDRFQKKGERFECMVGRNGGKAGGWVTIDDQTVGREHARIEFQKGFTITDSRGRTAIAGRRDAPMYKILQPPERIPPGVPLPLSPDMHLKMGLIDVIFLADMDENGNKVNFDEYRRAWDFLKASHLTRHQRKRVLAKAKAERASRREPHYGEILLHDGLVTTEIWFRNLFYALVYPPPEPGFLGGLVDRVLRSFRS